MPWLTLVYIMILCGGMGVLMAFSHPAIYVGDRRIAAWNFSRQFPEIHISTKYMSSYVQDQEDVEVYGTICSYLTEFNIRREDAFDYFDHNLAYLCVGFLGYGIRNYLIGTPPSQLWDILYDVGMIVAFIAGRVIPQKMGKNKYKLSKYNFEPVPSSEDKKEYLKNCRDTAIGLSYSADTLDCAVSRARIYRMVGLAFCAVYYFK